MIHNYFGVDRARNLLTTPRPVTRLLVRDGVIQDGFELQVAGILQTTGLQLSTSRTTRMQLPPERKPPKAPKLEIVTLADKVDVLDANEVYVPLHTLIEKESAVLDEYEEIASEYDRNETLELAA